MSLNGDIQGRNRFIADNEFRINGQGTGDSDSLPLTAGKFMGIPPHSVRRKSYLFEQPGDPVLEISR